MKAGFGGATPVNARKREARFQRRRARLVDGLVGQESFHQHYYARALAELVPYGCRWLDLGAGKVLHHGYLGPTPESLASRASLLIGCDVIVHHLRLNRSLDAGLGAAAELLPFRAASFDLVTANMVMEHLSDPVAVLSEVRRVLRPGGRFVFVTPNRANPLIFLASVLLSPRMRQRLAAASDDREEEDVFPTRYRCNTSRTIRACAHAAGLEVQQLSHFSTIPGIPRPLAAVWLECMLIRTLERPLLGALRSNILCQLGIRKN